jgi:ribosome-binding protein aMBF1 (putative translation factor)
MDNQDWTPVTLRSVASARKSASTAASHKHPPLTQEAATARKLEHSEEPVKIKQLSPEGRQLLTQHRAAAKLTQVQLNQQCCFPVNTVRDIEAGKIQPTSSQLQNLNRVLRTNVKLV